MNERSSVRSNEPARRGVVFVCIQVCVYFAHLHLLLKDTIIKIPLISHWPHLFLWTLWTTELCMLDRVRFLDFKKKKKKRKAIAKAIASASG